MADPKVTFSQNAASKIRQAVQGYLATPTDQTAGRGRRLSFSDKVFVAKLGSSTGSSPPYQYAFTEQYNSASSEGTYTWSDKTGGRTDDSKYYAQNVWESGNSFDSLPAANVKAVTGIVLMIQSFDQDDPPNPCYAFWAMPEKKATVMTNLQVNDGDMTIEIKTIDLLVIAQGTESDWTTIYTGEDCGTGGS